MDQVARLSFDCEGVFDKAGVRSAAERVLTRLVKDGPPRPQVHYLLGQLRVRQGRRLDAYQEFRKSVELDPDYMDGWVQRSHISKEVPITQTERERVAIEMLKLDPLRRHAFIDFEGFTDLRPLWPILESARQLFEAPPSSLVPLPASAREQGNSAPPPDRDGRISGYYSRNWYYGGRGGSGTPGEVIVSGDIARNMVNFWRKLSALDKTDE